MGGCCAVTAFQDKVGEVGRCVSVVLGIRAWRWEKEKMLECGVVSTACALWTMGPQDRRIVDTACGDVMQHKLMVGFFFLLFGIVDASDCYYNKCCMLVVLYNDSVLFTSSA